MKAAWYVGQGDASEVLRVGERPEPVPGDGEVRVRVRFSGVNPGDTKKREGWLGSAKPYPEVIPHSDGAGVVDQVGAGVDEELIARRVAVARRAVVPPVWYRRRVHRRLDGSRHSAARHGPR